MSNPSPGRPLRVRLPLQALIIFTLISVAVFGIAYLGVARFAVREALQHLAPLFEASPEAGGAQQDAMAAAVTDTVRRAVIPAFVVAYLVLLVVVLSTSNNISRSVSQLTHAAGQIIAGSGQSIPTVNCFVCHEINSLGDALAKTVEKTRAREAELAYSEARYRALVNSLPGPAYLTDANGTMTFVSPQILDLLGYTSDEWLSEGGRFLYRLVHPEDRDGHPDTVDLRGETRIWQTEARLLHKDGSYRWMENRFACCSGDGDSFVVGLILDIDERKGVQVRMQSYTDELKFAYEELQATQQQLIRSTKLASVGELATAVAHEINNPLAAVRGLAQLLASERPDDANLQEPLQRIISNTDRIVRTIKNLRGFARPPHSGRSAVNLNLVVDDALTLLNQQLAVHQIELVLELSPELPAAHGDPFKLGQVLINLLTNARDAIQEQDTPGRITIRTWFDANDRHIYLRVADNGVGIQPEHHNDVFAPFFTTKPDGLGTGLGLSISYRIIQEHKGHLTFESEPGRGSIFTIMLPAMEETG